MSPFWGGTGECPSALALGWHMEKQPWGWVWVWEPCTALAVLVPAMGCGEGGPQPQEASLDKTQFPSHFPATTRGRSPRGASFLASSRTLELKRGGKTCPWCAHLGIFWVLLGQGVRVLFGDRLGPFPSLPWLLPRQPPLALRVETLPQTGNLEHRKCWGGLEEMPLGGKCGSHPGFMGIQPSAQCWGIWAGFFCKKRQERARGAAGKC